MMLSDRSDLERLLTRLVDIDTVTTQNLDLIVQRLLALEDKVMRLENR